MGKRHIIICSLFLISILCPYHSLADYNGKGWYRIQNSANRVDVNGNNPTKRFISIAHNEGSVGMTGNIDGHSVLLLSDGDEISDPSSLLYVSGSLSAANFQALGTSIQNITGYSLKLTEKGSGSFGKLYNASVEINLLITTIKVLLQDAYEGTPQTSGIDKADGSGSAVNSADCQWFIRPVDVGDGGDTYFGVAPTEDDKIGDYYYTTLRTAFSYKLSTNVDAFIIDSNGVLTQLPHSDVVPINTPVILRCQSTNPSDNRLYPQVVGTKVFSSETSSVTSNLVKGTTYSYFKSSIVNAKEGNNGSYTRGTEYAFGTAYNDNIRVLSVENGKLGFFKTFHEAYPSDLCLNGRLAYYNLKAANNDVNGGLTLLETPALTPSTAEALVGGTISFTASKLSPKGGTLQYRIDDGDWINVTGTSVSFNVTSDVPKSGKVYARTINCGCPSNVVEATYTFTALSAPSITPASAEAEVGETITFTATNPNGGSSTMQYRIDGGAWTTTTGTITVTSNEAKTGTVEVKVINGNAESSVASATYTFAEAYQDIKLANLVNKPVDDTKYNITDLTCIYVIDNAGLLICKDDTCYASKDVTENGWIDYMQQVSGLNVPETYDQSNWIALRLPQGTAVTNDMIHAPLSGVKGHLVNANNLEFQLDVKPQFGSRVEFTPNTYIPASFKGTQESANGKTYFFVQPKPMEYAHIEWAVSRGDKFVTAPRDLEHGINTAGLSGEFEFNGMYLGDFGLEWDHVYMMDALIKRYTDNFDHVYVMGNVDGLVFDSRKGVEMYTADGKVYTATVTVSNAANNVNGFFGFTKELGATWESIAGYRYGANENNKYVTADTYDIVQGTNSFAILPGTYALTLNMETGKLTIATASANAPRRAEAQSTARYIVYPVNLTETSNSIITGVMNVAGAREVAAVEYVNLAGQRSSCPWQGVNIVVTRYTDGTVTTAKECK